MSLRMTVTISFIRNFGSGYRKPIAVRGGRESVLDERREFGLRLQPFVHVSGGLSDMKHGGGFQFNTHRVVRSRR